MTREQARREIDSLDYYLQNHTDDYGEESHTAMMMAIQALQAQTETKCNPNDCPHPYGTYETCNECKANGNNVFKMRDATPEEQEAIDKYIKSISKPTGVDFDSLSDSQIIHHLTDKAYSELCLLAEKGREALHAQGEQLISKRAVLDAIKFEDRWLFDAKSHNPNTKIAFSGIYHSINKLPTWVEAEVVIEHSGFLKFIAENMNPNEYQEYYDLYYHTTDEKVGGQDG